MDLLKEPYHRRRRDFVILIALTLCLGLFVRSSSAIQSTWIGFYSGDTIWAGMIYFWFALLFPRSSILRLIIYSALFCTLIEFGQFWKPSWLQAIRATRIGGLIFGFDFFWPDLVCYYVGITLAAAADIGLGKYITRPAH